MLEVLTPLWERVNDWAEPYVEVLNSNVWVLAVAVLSALLAVSAWLWRRFLGPIARRVRLRNRTERTGNRNKIVYFAAEHRPIVNGYLRYRYSQYPLLTVREHVYPVHVWYAGTTSAPNLDSVLLEPLLGSQRPFLAADTHHRRYMEIRGSISPDPRDERGYNAPTYALVRFRADGGLRMSCWVGTYFDTLDTCDSLEWETLAAIGRLPFSTRWPRTLHAARNRVLRVMMPQRNRLHRRVADPVVDGTGRCAGIGVSILVASKDATGAVQLLVRQRSTNVAVAHSQYHVAPAGMFQSFTGDPHDDYSVWKTAAREYLEELFRIKTKTERDDGGWLESDPNYRYLMGLIDSGQAQLVLTGVSVNLLSLRPEVLGLLYFRTPEWREAHAATPASLDGDPLAPLALNEEYVDAQHTDADGKALVRWIKYSSSDEEMLATSALLPQRMVPSGAAAFWAGVAALRRLDPALDGDQGDAQIE